MTMRKEWANDNWLVVTQRAPILDSNAMDAAEERLQIPIPEMIFGSATISIRHKSGWGLQFLAMDALDLVDKKGGQPGQFKLAYEDEWLESRKGHSDQDVTKVHRPFDWTYTTAYKGTETSAQLRADPKAVIPFDRLKKPKPILLYDEVSLFEDELGDNGLVTYSGKIRVMDGELLLLVRFYLRVDNVAFRIRDTRVYVDFAENTVIRSYIEKEETFEKVQAKIPVGTKDHTQVLRDPVWIDSVLPVVYEESHKLELR